LTNISATSGAGPDVPVGTVLRVSVVMEIVIVVVDHGVGIGPVAAARTGCGHHRGLRFSIRPQVGLLEVFGRRPGSPRARLAVHGPGRGAGGPEALAK
jgi:hypothetical protein